METKKVDVRLPMAVHEATIRRHFAREFGEIVGDDVLDSMFDAAQVAREAAERALSSHDKIMANPMKPALANQRESRENGFKLLDSASKKIDRTRDQAERAIIEIEKRTWGPPEPRNVGETMIEAEIRSALAALSPDKRSKAIEEAISSGDEALIGAYLRGPALLVGGFPAEREAHRHAWRMKRHPKEVDRVARLGAALRDLDRAQATLLSFINGLTDGVAIARAEAAERAALASKVA